MNVLINWILPLVYCAFLAWLLMKNNFLQLGGLNQKFIVLFFLAKCFVGFIAVYISLRFFKNGGDIYKIHNEALDLYHLLFKRPKVFLSQLHDFFKINDFNLIDSKSGIIQGAFNGIKLLNLFFDFFSFGNIFTNIILFNGLASWVFLRCWVFIKKTLKTEASSIWIFLMPSVFFYTTLILKEGIVFIIISLILPLAYQFFKLVTPLRFIAFIILFALLFFIKFLIAVTFLGALAVWGLMIYYPKKKNTIVVLFTVTVVSSFFLLKYVNHVFDLPKYITERQQEFLALKANSKIPVAILEPTFGSFLKALPTALNNVFLKPLPGEGGKTMYYVFAIEILCFWVLLLGLWFANKCKANFSSISPLVWALFIFGMANLLIIGYTIPNIGAITRYRSIFLPFVGLFFWTAFNGNKLLNKS